MANRISERAYHKRANVEEKGGLVSEVRVSREH